jgi:prepilin-type processing-associated H-X9-DG protein
MAVASLVLGIVSVVTCIFAPITAPLGLIFGIIALKKSGRNGLALAGTIVSGFALALAIPMGAAVILPAMMSGRQAAQKIQCSNNEKELALAIRNYSISHDNHFPSVATWCDDIKPQVRSAKVFQCPTGNPNQRSHFAFNSRLDGKDITRVAPETVMLFETTGGWNQSGGQELLLAQPRHTRTSQSSGNQAWVNVAFVDGSVQRLTESQLSTLRWDP